MNITPREQESYDKVQKYLKTNPGKPQHTAYTATGVSQGTYWLAKKKITEGFDPRIERKSKSTIPRKKKVEMQTITVNEAVSKFAYIVVVPQIDLAATLKSIGM